MTTYTFDKVFKLFLSALLAIGGFILLKHLADVLLPFFMAFLLAYLLNPLVELIQKKVPYRAASVAIVLISVVVLLAAIIGVLMPYLFSEFKSMSELLQKFASEKGMVIRLNKVFKSDIWLSLQMQLEVFTQGEWKTWIQDKDHWTTLQKMGQKILPGALGILSGAGSILTSLLGLLVILLYLIFMLSDYDRLKTEGLHFIPENWRGSFLEFLGDFDLAMNRYFRAQAMLALCVGIIFAVGFSFIGLPMAILLGLGIGALNMVPYLQIVGLIPAAFLGVIHALEVEANPLSVLFWVAMVFVLAQVVQEAVLTPKLMGDVTGLSPALILLSISIWGKLLGFFGLIIAIPFTCLFVAYGSRYQKMIVRAIDTSKSP
jgi:predicted PurR-regulated permease PerM